MACLLGLAWTGTAWTEHGETAAPRVEIGTTLTALASNQGEYDPLGLVSHDLLARAGRWSLLLEFTASPGTAMHSPPLPGAIPNPGGKPAAGDQRLAVAELFYGFEGLGGEWSLGLLDGAAHIDTSVVANDEKTQFMSPEFVNNPLIGMPGGRLGLAYFRPGSGSVPGVSALLMSSAGVEEEYSMGVEPAAHGPGRFLALEAQWALLGGVARLGGWEQSRDWRALPGSDGSRPVRGLYVSVDGSLSRIHWNLRLGVANGAMTERAAFFAVAALLPLGADAIGLAVGRSMHPDNGAIGNGPYYLEAFYQNEVLPGWTISPGVQIRQAESEGRLARELRACIRMNLAF